MMKIGVLPSTLFLLACLVVLGQAFTSLRPLTISQQQKSKKTPLNHVALRLEQGRSSSSSTSSSLLQYDLSSNNKNDKNNNKNNKLVRPSPSFPRLVSRATVVSTTIFIMTLAMIMGPATTTTMSAFAKDIVVDPSIKGTKKDPTYETCVSNCLFLCTKPKGDDQKNRQECLPECKMSCATTKEQLMIGTPIKKEE